MENNWCIKLDDENRDVVIKYLNEKFRIELCDIELCGDRIYYGVYCNNIYCDDVVLETEINIKQFIEMIKDEGYKVMYNPIMNKFEYVCKPAYSAIKFNNSTNILSTSKNNPPINKFLSELDKDTKEVPGTPSYYDNSKGTIYKIAQDRNWNAYVFEAVKRLDRAEKKGEFISDIDKTIKVLELYKLEQGHKFQNQIEQLNK